MSSNSQMEMCMVTFCPGTQSMGFSLSNHHGSQTLRRKAGCGQQYKRIFQNIEPPLASFDDGAQLTQEDLNTLSDCRFYIAMKASSGYSWKVETVIGPKLVSIHREVAPFPTLSEIVRFQLHKGLEQDAYCKMSEIVFHSNRYDFLNNIFYPEICSQLDLLVTKSKLSTQIGIASHEQKHRAQQQQQQHHPQQTTTANTITTVSHLPPLQTSFTDMDDDCLSAWIRDATDIVNERKLKLSPTEPSLTNLSPSEFITIPYNYKNGFRYSFVRYGDCQSALPTAELVLKARKFYRNSKFLSASIELARRCPHLVLPVQPPNEYQLNNLDCLKSLMAFLSYGFYDISRQRK